MIQRSIILVCLIAGTVLIGLSLRTPRRDAYQRFVSPPRKDGTRYTFVYPTRLTPVPAGTADFLSGVSFYRPRFPRTLEEIKLRLSSGTRHATYAMRAENLLLLVTPERAANMAGRREGEVQIIVSPLQGGGSPVTGPYSHQMEVFSPQAECRFRLNYDPVSGLSAIDRLNPSLWRQDCETITRSFQIIHPGESVPSGIAL
jgi:hypothetical protein